jgi:hypothetical protein
MKLAYYYPLFSVGTPLGMVKESLNYIVNELLNHISHTIRQITMKPESDHDAARRGTFRPQISFSYYGHPKYATEILERYGGSN